MTFSYLTALKDSIRASSAVMALVDGRIEMNLAVEQLESHLHGPNQSCINLSMAAWNGESTGIQALFNVEIRSRISQEYTYQIADAVRDLIEHGFSQTYSGTIFRVYVAKVLAETSKGETPRTYRVTQTVMGSLTQINTHDTVPSISALTLSPSSPQSLTTGLKIKLACTASDLDGDPILYKFEHSGPATGGAWIALSVWQENNDTDWRPGRADLGTNYFRVKVIDGYHAGRGSYDAILASEAFVIADNALPILSSLASSLASPQVVGTALKFIAEASDEGGDWILYRFWLNGPSTKDVWEDQTGWITKNEWTWTPKSGDVGANQIKVHVIDQHHSGRSGYDATMTISFTINDNELPSISELAVIPNSPAEVGTLVKLVCDAFPNDSDALLFKFTVIGPGTGFLEVALTGWQAQNNCVWTSQLADVGHSVLKVYVRDGNHAGPGSYDDFGENEFEVLNTPPIIGSLAPVLASPQVAEREIKFICEATYADTGAELHYKFWHRGPNTLGIWLAMTGWQVENHWTWRATIDDTGTNYIKVYVRTGRSAGPGSYDDMREVTFVITS